MKKKIVFSTQYKKDFKCYRHNTKMLEVLMQVILLLENGLPLPISMRPHKLTGNYAGCLECHIGNDFLLIWVDENDNTVHLLRLGSHSELFS